MTRVRNIFAALLVAIGLLAIPLSGNAQDGDAGWQATIDGQLRAFQSGDGAAAYDFAAPNITRVFPSIDIFMGMVASGYPQVRNPRSWSMGRSEAISESSVMQEVILTGPDGRTWKAAYMMERQPDGSWKIAGVSLEGMETFGV